MFIFKAGLIAALTVAGIGLVSVSVTPAERAGAKTLQYSTHEQVVRSADIVYPVSTLLVL
jgi:hypothetical protein